jgi:hypothetical protein
MGWDGVLYCLDPVADTDAEVTALSEQIWGHELHGQALIDGLALPVIDQHDTDCKYIFDFEGPYYCLDSAASSKADALALWNQVIGTSSSPDARIAEAEATLQRLTARLDRAIRRDDQEALETLKLAIGRVTTRLVDLRAAEPDSFNDPAGSIPTAEEIVAGQWPLGSELADMLSLSLVGLADGPCQAYFGVEGSGRGYCLDGLPEGGASELDVYVTGKALQGHRLTEVELAAARDTLANAGNG